MKYYGTYYFANIVQSVCKKSFDYLTNFEELFGDNHILDYVEPFRKKSNLHIFIEFVIDSLFIEEAGKLDLINCRDRSNYDFSNPTYITPLEIALKKYDLEHESFVDWFDKRNLTLNDNCFGEYYSYLFQEDLYCELLESLSNDVFYILFLNRQFLQEFNGLFADYLEGCVGDKSAVSEVINSDLIHVVRPNFKLFRKNIPTWVQRAVFYRDRGRCTHCNKDLSGILAINNFENYDHIVPLNLYGFNDVTNIQLLCRECNAEKRGDAWDTSIKYESWY
jgi:hypothetical protein